MKGFCFTMDCNHGQCISSTAGISSGILKLMLTNDYIWHLSACVETYAFFFHTSGVAWHSNLVNQA